MWVLGTGTGTGGLEAGATSGRCGPRPAPSLRFLAQAPTCVLAPARPSRPALWDQEGDTPSGGQSGTGSGPALGPQQPSSSPWFLASAARTVGGALAGLGADGRRGAFVVLSQPRPAPGQWELGEGRAGHWPLREMPAKRLREAGWGLTTGVRFPAGLFPGPWQPLLSAGQEPSGGNRFVLPFSRSSSTCGKGPWLFIWAVIQRV